jgi:hypothetical protein
LGADGSLFAAKKGNNQPGASASKQTTFLDQFVVYLKQRSKKEASFFLGGGIERLKDVAVAERNQRGNWNRPTAP